jgi:hypothetical protein
MAASSTLPLRPLLVPPSVGFRTSNGIVTVAFVSIFRFQKRSVIVTSKYGLGRIG